MPSEIEKIKPVPEPAPAPASGGSKKPLRDPTRTQILWYPGALLCKRFNVPVPTHARGTPNAQPARKYPHYQNTTSDQTN